MFVEKICGAKTRQGKPCQRKLLLRGGKCPNHGGLSSGPRTEAGKAIDGKFGRLLVIECNARVVWKPTDCHS
jgi:hypothetical protein